MSSKFDFAYALRRLVRSPGFSLAVVLSLALAIGANAAIFSVVNGLLFHPSGIRDPQKLVAPRVTYRKLDLSRIPMSATDFADIRGSRNIFSTAAMADIDGFNYSGGSSPERVEGAMVTWQWFEVFGAKPLLGRGFHREQDLPGANHVVVLSYASWRRLFGGDKSVIGRTVELNKEPYRVIGVMPANFRWPAEADVWMPLGLAPQSYGPNNRFNENYFAVARLAPGVTYSRAASAVQELSGRVLDDRPFARASQWRMELEPLTEYVAGDLKTPMLTLLGAVGFVLLIACSNIAGLMLVRGTAGARELAIRTALGASRRDLISQTVTEIFLLSAAGTGLGFFCAFGILRALVSLARVKLSTELFVRIDGHVLAFTAAAGLLSAFVFGLIPAWHISRLGQHYEQLKEGGRSDTEGHQRQALRSALVAGQIALALVLLAGAGLLVKSLDRLRNVNAGLDGRNVVTASVALPGEQYREPDKQVAFVRAVLQQLSQTPGVAAEAAASTVPFGGGDPTASFGIEGRVVAPGDPGFHGSIRYVTPDYFRTLKIPLLAGRYFNDGDRKNGQPVALIDVDMARRYWPNENPIGRRLRHNSSDPWATIVGIVGHVKQTSLAADAGRGVYYFCLYQQPSPEMYLAARGVGASTRLGDALRNAVLAVDPAEAVFDVKTMQERISLALGPQQFATRILMAFAGAALLLAVIGLYGVISYTVTRRTREIGIRTALGAERSRIIGLVVGQAMRLLLIGMFSGLVVAASIGRLAASQLFEVSPFDPGTFAITALVLTAAAVLASLVPAWRAARVDPIVALRNE